MKKNIMYAFLPLIISSAFAQNVEDTVKASAKIENFCKISASDVNFGVLVAPLTAQTANSQMQVLCNNNTPYEISMAYGGVYGSGGEDTGYTIGLFQSVTDVAQYRVNKPNGLLFGYLECGRDSRKGTVSFTTIALARFYGYENYTSSYVKDTNNTCISDGTKAGTYPTGWVGPFNAPRQPIYTSGYNYGMLVGAVNSDNVAYKITLPNDSTKVWNNGSSKYSAIGNGSVETISINAQIVPDKSSSLYPAQDIYLDNVTATIAY